MMKKFAVLTVLMGLTSGSSFAMEAFESGDPEQIRAKCSQKIQEFDGKNPGIARKFDALLLLCLDDESFYQNLSNGSYFKAFESIKPHLQEAPKSFGSSGAWGGATETSYSSDAEMARLFQAQLNLENQPSLGADSDAALARRLQEEFENERGWGAFAQATRGFPKEEVLDGFSVIRRNPRFDDMKRQIAPIFTHIESLPNMADVHVLDGYVGANLASVVDIGRTLRIGNPDLSFENVQENMKKYFQSNPIKLKLNGADLPQATFLGYVDAVFQPDFKGQSDLFRELVSRTWSFAHEVHSRGQDGDRFLTELASGIVENYALAGGCLPGRVNRFFAAYVRMLHYATNDLK